MATDLVAVVHMAMGRWAARCPRPGCANAECFGRCDDGSFGGLVDDGTFRCRPDKGGCGLICRAQWPPNVADLERVLLARPVPTSRNWQPGETVADLVAENIDNGLVPSDLLGGDGTAGRRLLIAGDDVAGGLGFTDVMDIGAVDRREIRG